MVVHTFDKLVSDFGCHRAPNLYMNAQAAAVSPHNQHTHKHTSICKHYCTCINARAIKCADAEQVRCMVTNRSRM